MTTAREQAREAVSARHKVREHTGTNVGAWEAADAASDVWEPIVRDLLNAFVWSRTGYSLSPEDDADRKAAAIKRGEEALGD